MSSSSTTNAGRRRRSKGRQRIEIKKMENESNLQVTFSKRRAGLFKKASELCTLCGVEVALIVFSPGDKAFSFGHPSVDAVLDRFLNGGVPPQPPSAPMQMMEVHRNAAVQELNSQLTQVMEELEVEKKRGEELNRRMKEMENKFWWAKPVNTLNKDQLVTLKASLEEMKKTFWRRADNAFFHMASNANKPFQFHVGSSSSGRQLTPPPQPPPMQMAASPAAQVFPTPFEQTVLPQQPPMPLPHQMIQNPMFEGNMMLSPPPPPPPPATQGFRQYQNMGEHSGSGYY
ncbi:agamous-like MADS-box protein AGL62 [Prosopis cineraria]|uniref:agamous-like MADS-box protein AGL62 n=1 Tax=Prosopis cineraria TaxID=364024 RepID=UPI0024105EA2|nr:agamous-like MADS-box protein AGL62 [Prosopis cineraria]